METKTPGQVTRSDTRRRNIQIGMGGGAQLVSLEKEKDEQLLQLFDTISHTANFYYGRYDIKCTSLNELKEGNNFCIVEFNGTGAEPHHMYGNRNNFIEAAK